MTREEAITRLYSYKQARCKGCCGHCEQCDFDVAIDTAIEALEAEPTVIRCRKLLSEEDFKAVAERIRETNQNVIVIPYETEVVSTETSTETSTDLISRAGVSAWLSNMGHDKLASAVMDTRRFPSADRPSGEWILEEEYGDLWVCDQCGFANEHNDNYCPNCGAKMGGNK